MAAVLHHADVTGTDKVILLGIANHAGDGGAWPSIATLARYAGVTRQTASRAVSRLVAQGHVTRDVNAGGTPTMRDHERPNLYQVLTRCPPDCDGTTAHRVADTPPPGAHATPPRGADATPPLAHTPPEPSVEPSVEPKPLATGVATDNETVVPAIKTRRQQLFEALVDVCGYQLDELTRTARGRVNAAAKELDEIGATPAGVVARAAVYKRTWPDVSLTPQGLTGNYAELGNTRTGRTARPTADTCSETNCHQPVDRHDDAMCGNTLPDGTITLPDTASRDWTPPATLQANPPTTYPRRHHDRR